MLSCCRLLLLLLLRRERHPRRRLLFILILARCQRQLPLAHRTADVAAVQQAVTTKH